MSKRTLIRLLVVLAICFGCGYFFIPLNKIKLGLDLKGGVHFELEVQGQEALENDLKDMRERLLDKLKEKGLPLEAKLQGDSILVEGILPEQRAQVEKLVKDERNYDHEFKDGKLLIRQTAFYQDYLKDDANKRALQIIEKRINQYGVAEPEITPAGKDGSRIVVELPGVEDADRERIKGLLSTPGRLELRMLSKLDVGGWPTKEAALAQFGGQLPPETELIPEVERTKQDPKQAAVGKVKGEKDKEIIRRWLLMETKVRFEGSCITDARASIDPNTEANEVNFTLNSQGAKANAEVTEIAAREQRLFAFILDKKAVSVVSAQEKIIGSGVRISGRFTKHETEDLASKLRSGAMRASMKFLEERVVGPSLGRDSIKAGVRGSLIGFVSILIFMVVWYKWSGVNALVALIVNIIVMLGLLGSFQATLTLPGIAGFALTIGMAVDANILIFERIREELGLGKSVAMAIKLGFDRVFWTIVDSHVTQLFAALLLFIFGTGPVKGFAVSLVVGVVASLFTSIYISRYIYDWILERHPNATKISI